MAGKRKSERKATGTAPPADTARLPEGGPQPPEAAPRALEGAPIAVPAARIAVIALTVATHLGVLDNQLLEHWDDERFLSDPDVLRPSLSGLVGFFTEVRFEAYHPLHLLSYWLDVPWVGTEGPLAAAVIHGVNLALFVGAVVVFFEVLRKLGLSSIAAAVGALFFGVHPLTVEIVAWASARKDVLAIGLSLGATWFHLSTDGAPSRPMSDRNAWISRGLFLCAALAKTSALPLPLVLIALDLWTRRRPLKEAVLFQLPALLLALALGAGVLAVWRDNDMIRNTGSDRTAFDLWLVPSTLFHLVRTSFWPVDLGAMYPLHRHAPLPPWWGAGVFALLGIALSASFRRRAVPLAWGVGLGITWFALFALPVLNIVPMYFQWQDRYGCLPLLGLAIAVGAGIDAVRTEVRRDTLVRIAVTSLVILVPLAWLTVLQVETWQDDDHLWGNATRTSPRAYFAWVKLGETRRSRGDLDRSLDAYVEAIEIAPDIRVGHGGLFLSLALRDEAREDLTPSAALSYAARYLASADDAQALRDLAAEMVDAGYRDSATYALARSLDLDPVSDERLEQAISYHLSHGDAWLARFYLSRLSRRPVLRDVSGFWESERERLGLVTDEEREARSRPGPLDDAVRSPGEPIVIPVAP